MIPQREAAASAADHRLRHVSFVEVDRRERRSTPRRRPREEDRAEITQMFRSGIRRISTGAL